MCQLVATGGRRRRSFAGLLWFSFFLVLAPFAKGAENLPVPAIVEEEGDSLGYSQSSPQGTSRGQWQAYPESVVPRPGLVRPKAALADLAHNPEKKAAKAKSAREEERSLDGHIFLRNGQSTFPFIAPYINSSLQAALATFNISGADQPLKTVGLSPSFNGQFRVGKLGVELGASLQEIFGANSYSAYVVGANLDYIFSATLRYEAVRESNWTLTPAVFVSLDKGIGFSPLTAINQAISNPGASPTSGLLTNTTTRLVRPELLAAFAPSPIFGFTGELGAGFKYASASTPANSHLFRFGVSAETNFAPAFRIPLGAAVFFTDDIPVATTDTATPILGAGLYEMINHDFNFGMEWARLMTNAPSLSLTLSLTAYY